MTNKNKFKQQRLSRPADAYVFRFCLLISYQNQNHTAIASIAIPFILIKRVVLGGGRDKGWGVKAETRDLL